MTHILSNVMIMSTLPCFRFTQICSLNVPYRFVQANINPEVYHIVCPQHSDASDSPIQMPLLSAEWIAFLFHIHRSWFQISDRKSAILIEFSDGSSHFLKTNIGKHLILEHDHFLPYNYKIITYK